MLGSIESRLSQRSVVAIDVLVLLWTVAWLVLGITVGTFVERLGAVGESVEGAGHAIHRAGDAVGRLTDVPLVGEGFEAVANEIRTIGNETVQNGRSVEQDIDTLALLIGVGLAVGPTLPVLAVWIPPRMSRERERRELRRSLKSGDGVALAYLANRAVAGRLFRELRTASDDPVADLAAGRYEALAALELEHLALGSTSWLPRPASSAREEPSRLG
ncbi:MAG: hypothetical protein ABWY83_07695 [Actinomycetota bacterium]